jgi:hypothetical protein
VPSPAKSKARETSIKVCVVRHWLIESWAQDGPYELDYFGANILSMAEAEYQNRWFLEKKIARHNNFS